MQVMWLVGRHPVRMIDTTDLRLLHLLQGNARTSNAELARGLEMAPSAVHQRLRKLEDRGVVQGYDVRIDPRAVDRGLVAFLQLQTDERLGEFHVAQRLAALPEVLELRDVAGEDCYLAKVRARDTDDLHRLIREVIAGVEGVRSTRTTIVLKTLKERSALPLPVPANDDTNEDS